MAKLGGSPTTADVEYTVSNYYFGFQVVQVFLVATLSGAASSAGAEIAKNPSKIFDLLSTSIPKSSNFYLSYIIVQGLGVVAGLLANVAGLVVTPLLARFLGSTPRKLFLRWNTLKQINYGTVFPIYTNLLIIAMVYSVVAPLVTLFSVVGLYFFYVAYRYNILFVYDTGPDTKGLLFPRALQQLFVGLYIGEVCLIGLVATAMGKQFKGAIGPLILLILLLIVTALYHVALNAAFAPLLKFLPKDLDAEERRASTLKESAVETPTADKGTTETQEDAPLPIVLAPKHPKPNMLTKFLKPHIYADYATMRRLMPHDMLQEQDLDDVLIKDAYLPPSVWAELPRLIIPRDPAGISGPEVLESGKVVPITDAGATLNEKNKIVLDEERMGELFFQEKSQRMRYEAA
jgi:calcium permeable stress-gated cation channel